MPSTKKPTPATPSSAYMRMVDDWNMVETLLGGTKAMRAAGRTYLPQHENETDHNYLNRLAGTTLLNMTEQTLDTLAGKPFREDLVLGDDVPEQLAQLCEDVDLQGHNLHSFARAWFRDAWAKGFSHVLVDAPAIDPEGPDGQPRTLADDRAEGNRPYWVHVRPESLIAAYSEVRHGEEVLTHVRIRECAVERDEWGEVERVRIRVLEPGLWALYAPVAGKDDLWELEVEGTTGLDHIPLVTFYAGKRTGLMECKPPLVDLAHLNVQHWQSSSDQRNVLTVARFPILAGAGVSADQTVSVGPKNFLTTEDPQGKWYYVEHTGAAIEAGAKDLEAIEDAMASYGAEYLRKRPGDETATGRALDSAESSSYLAATVRDFKDCVEQALGFTAELMKLDGGGSVVVGQVDDAGEASQTELDALQKARAGRDISRATYLQALQSRGILPDDFDAEADAELLAEEAQDSMGDMFGGGNGTGGFGNRPPGNQPPVGGPAATDA